MKIFWIILNYSRKIELKWSLTLIKHKNKEDASQLKSKLEENNQQLKDTAKKYLNSSNNDSDSAKRSNQKSYFTTY